MQKSYHDAELSGRIVRTLLAIQPHLHPRRHSDILSGVERLMQQHRQLIVVRVFV